MANWPCRNSSCNSYGRPHPNCKCAPQYAHGGSVESYCSAKQKHMPGCNYYADGGYVGPLNDIDPSHAVAGHVMNGGILGILRMDRDHDLSKYERSVAKGHNTVDDIAGKVLDGTSLGKPENRDDIHEKIDNWISNGGVAQDVQNALYKSNATQMLAHGGEAKKPDGAFATHPVETAYPDQNVLLNMTRGRVSNYLNSLRPQPNTQRLAFDGPPDQTQQKKDYDEAVKIAAHPLSIFHEVSQGTLVPDHIKHLDQMYPEVSDALQKKVTEKIIHSQLSDKKPKSKIRQSLSLLLGSPLSGEMTPQGIQAAQSVFAQKQGQQTPQQGKPRSSKAALTKSDRSFLTNSQELVSRQQRGT